MGLLIFFHLSNTLENNWKQAFILFSSAVRIRKREKYGDGAERLPQLCTQEHSSSLFLILHSYHAVLSSIQIACCFSIATPIKQATHFKHLKDVSDHVIHNCWLFIFSKRKKSSSRDPLLNHLNTSYMQLCSPPLFHPNFSSTVYHQYTAIVQINVLWKGNMCPGTDFQGQFNFYDGYICLNTACLHLLKYLKWIN